MLVDLPVLAVQALALLGALLARSKALTVVFATLRFFTSASLQRHQGRYAFECSWMPEVGKLTCLVDLNLAVMLIAAIVAYTLLIAELTLRKTFTVHLQAVYFTAFAPLGRLLSWRQIQ